jgi:hypothetical protein
MENAQGLRRNFRQHTKSATAASDIIATKTKK